MKEQSKITRSLWKTHNMKEKNRKKQNLKETDIEESRRKHQKNYASQSREDRVSIKQEQSTIEKKE